jgi:hypothetical protein
MNVGIPPRSLNHRTPAAVDAPTATAASSLLRPLAISLQNRRSTSRRNDGAPGDLNGALPVNSLIHPAGLPIHTSTIKVLRGPLESAVFSPDLVPTSRLAERYAPIITGRPAFISFQTATELRYGAIRRGWIAATALRLRIPLVSNDTIFKVVPGLTVESLA